MDWIAIKTCAATMLVLSVIFLAMEIEPWRIIACWTVIWTLIGFVYVTRGRGPVR